MAQLRHWWGLASRRGGGVGGRGGEREEEEARGRKRSRMGVGEVEYIRNYRGQMSGDCR